MAEVTFVQSSYPSANGRDTVACYVWTPAEPPRGVVQIVHGMQEYVRRYEPFVQFLCANGYAVGGNDHLGHGGTAASDADLGFTGEGGGADAMIADMGTMTARLKAQFSGLPVFLVGHSMGSFIARAAVADRGEDYAGAVFLGTGGPNMPTGPAMLLCRWRMFRRGERHPSNLIAKVAFGNYNRRYDGPVTKNSWISRDEEVVKTYMADKLCNFPYTARGWYDLFDLLARVSQRDWAGKLPDNLPVLLASGTMDPVGSFSRGVEAVHRRLAAAGVRDLTLKLYPDARHELLNEINRDEVYADILVWLDARKPDKKEIPHA